MQNWEKAFHLHCFSRHIGSSDDCPICRCFTLRVDRIDVVELVLFNASRSRERTCDMRGKERKPSGGGGGGRIIGPTYPCTC